MTQHAVGDRGSRILAVLGLMTLATCAVVIWNLTPETTIADDPVLKRRPMTLFKGVHLLGGLNPSVAYVVETSEGLVLVDSGLEANCQSLMQQMKYLQLNPGRLKKILLTHAHGDHVLGAMYLQRLTGARIYAGRADSDILRAGGPPEALFSTYDMPGIETHPTEVDVELKGGETIQSGDVRFEVIGTPGHTPGSLCFLLEHDGRRILFSGDTIQSITGDLGTYAAYLAPRYRSSARDYLASLKQLREMAPPDILLPGHPQVRGPAMDPQDVLAGGNAEEQGVSAEVTSQQWQELLESGIDEMQALVARYDADGEDFLDGTPRQVLTGLYYLGEFEGSAVYVLKHRAKWILFDAPGGPGLEEFLKDQLQGLGQAFQQLSTVIVTSTSLEQTTGLPRLVQKFKCTVIARRDGIEELRGRLPDGTRFLAAEDLDDQAALPIKAIPLSGLGTSPMGYQFQREDKTVLVSGPFLVQVNTPQSVNDLQHHLSSPGANIGEFENSLGQLGQIKPQVWLPARPVNGQNANLYDDQWRSILNRNRSAIHQSSPRQ